MNSAISTLNVEKISNLNQNYVSYRHPGFLSFGSVQEYTQVSPPLTYFVFDLLLGLGGRRHPFQSN